MNTFTKLDVNIHVEDGILAACWWNRMSLGLKCVCQSGKLWVALEVRILALQC